LIRLIGTRTQANAATTAFIIMGMSSGLTLLKSNSADLYALSADD
jgi:hypothetical protein